MSRDPNERPARCGDFMNALRVMLGDDSIENASPTLPRKKTKPSHDSEGAKDTLVDDTSQTWIAESPDGDD